MNHQAETVYHVTVLSNFARAFDKYSRTYDKAQLPESTYPDQFFVLRDDELAIGIEKAKRLLEKLDLPGDRLLVVAAELDSSTLYPNERTGKGRYIRSARLPVSKLFFLEDGGALTATIPEEAYAASLGITEHALQGYGELKPRTLSVLPIARACQAACRFCFSESSASLEQVPHTLEMGHVGELCVRAKRAGAERFVITGGGEPGLVRHQQMLELIRTGRRHFDKVVLITNGIHLSKLEEDARLSRLKEYVAAGLSVLSVSRHHHDAAHNAGIMGVDTRTDAILRTFARNQGVLESLRLRLICVLQKGGIEDDATLAAYADWAVANGVSELCFKELYVSTTTESIYHAKPENQWSLDNQVSLSLITRLFDEQGFKVASRLPWGAPVLSGSWNGHPLAVAAYTEPSLFWERKSGIARSWNIMADGQCLVSLEDPSSTLPGVRQNRVIPILELP
jgi:molybdenum cofactor biosynthesis enzyme MoaA